MGLSINGSENALFGVRQLQQSTLGLARVQERLASFQRINRAADDAAGLAISEAFRSQIRGLNTEIRGIQSGINFTQTAEGGLTAQSDAVGRIRELAVQSANGTLSDDQRAALNAEAQQLIHQVDAIGNETEFNGVRPLDGSAGPITVDAAGSLEIQADESTAASLGLNGLDLSTQAGASAALGQLDTAREQIDSNRATLGAQESGLTRAINERENTALNLTEAESRIRDVDVAEAFIERTREEVLLQSGVATLAQAGNLTPAIASRLLTG